MSTTGSGRLDPRICKLGKAIGQASGDMVMVGAGCPVLPRGTCGARGAAIRSGDLKCARSIKKGEIPTGSEIGILGARGSVGKGTILRINRAVLTV